MHVLLRFEIYVPNIAGVISFGFLSMGVMVGFRMESTFNAFLGTGGTLSFNGAVGKRSLGLLG